MKPYEWKWGLAIGFANMLWLFLSFFMGMHSSGIGLIQVTVALAFFITLIGYVLAFRAIGKVRPDNHFAEGLKSGAIIAVIAACLAILSQLIYFQWINPGWTDYMVSQTRDHFSARGLDAAQVEAMVTQAKASFSLRSYTIQAGFGAILQGVIFSAMIMGVIRWRARR
ncbi:MAG: DUF4199 domain-containing protein [Verrucomicrobiales bacterium]|nr:DUF4199 domain-containing protein [Verrucomicrobiales bacterium]